MIDKIKIQLKCLLDDAKHFWMFHRKFSLGIIAGLVILWILI